jgi:hypothetical protein
MKTIFTINTKGNARLAFYLLKKAYKKASKDAAGWLWPDKFSKSLAEFEPLWYESIITRQTYLLFKSWENGLFYDVISISKPKEKYDELNELAELLEYLDRKV